jgi:hypothetical protein
MTAFSRLSRFGMTYKPLTESRGEELLTLYLEGFRAKTSAQQEKAQALTESEAECGEKWRASFTKYDPDMRLWKTHQCSLLGGLEPFSETWPQWGLMRNGECWEQRMLGRRIKETGFGLWPTPCAMDSSATMVETKEQWQARNKEKKAKNPKLGEVQKSLRSVVTWPTPTSHNAKETNAPSESERNTPTLAAQAGGQLNPAWVEWLMGWPLGWTDLKPLATDKSHCVQQQHGDF